MRQSIVEVRPSTRVPEFRPAHMHVQICCLLLETKPLVQVHALGP